MVLGEGCGLTNTATTPAIISVARVLIYLDQPTIGALPGLLPVAMRAVIFTLAAIIAVVGFRSHAAVNTELMRWDVFACFRVNHGRPF